MCPPVRFTIYRWSISEKARIANHVIEATEWTLRQLRPSVQPAADDPPRE
jgi:hypothetical protein